MPPASASSIHDKFIAKSKGIVKELPAKLKFVYIGETFAAIKELPTVSCHHGTNNEIVTSRRVVIPPAKPNQFNLACKSFSPFY